MSADVSKKYKQVELCPRDRPKPWRFQQTEPVDTYRLTRVTYGVAGPPYHSIRSLNFEDTQESVRDALTRDFYVDDILTGASSETELQGGLIKTLKKGQCDLRKWTCTLPELVLRLPAEYREANEEFKFLDETHTIKMLGVVWVSSSDKFIVTVSHLSNDLDEATITKRKMLSDIAKIFDPRAWLSTVSLELKHLMKQVWQCRVDWDQQKIRLN